METILWHDYETFGTDPALDRPSQFAAIRTNLDLEPVEEPVMLYCAPSDDVLPSLDACLITGITPQAALEKGVPEPEFVAHIHDEFIRAGTCGAGYNSIRFDDEVTRHCFYRNFYDPYAREWQNGNSRWDIIDMVRATYALRPDGIEWPESESGIPSFRLELLSAANNLAHESAHDALSDVRATIALAKLIRDMHPRLYEYCWQLRDKHRVSRMLDLHQHKPVVHVSSKIPASRGCTSVFMPLAKHPQNGNGVICIDLSEDPKNWIELSVEDMQERLYKKSEDLEEGEARIPVKTIHLNRSPIICPLSMLDAAAQQRLQIDLDACEQHWQQLLAETDLDKKISRLFNEPFLKTRDTEASLYSRFIPDIDKKLCQEVVDANEEDLKKREFVFSDNRLNELLFRYKARHFPASLDAEQTAIWEEYVAQRYLAEIDGNKSVFDQHMNDLNERMSEDRSPFDRTILEQLKIWMLDFRKRYNRAL